MVKPTPDHLHTVTPRIAAPGTPARVSDGVGCAIVAPWSTPNSGGPQRFPSGRFGSSTRGLALARTRFRCSTSRRIRSRSRPRAGCAGSRRWQSSRSELARARNASSRPAASSSAPGSRWPYWSSVILMFAWPMKVDERLDVHAGGDHQRRRSRGGTRAASAARPRRPRRRRGRGRSRRARRRRSGRSPARRAGRRRGGRAARRGSAPCGGGREAGQRRLDRGAQLGVLAVVARLDQLRSAYGDRAFDRRPVARIHAFRQLPEHLVGGVLDHGLRLDRGRSRGVGERGDVARAGVGAEAGARPADRPGPQQDRHLIDRGGDGTAVDRQQKCHGRRPRATRASTAAGGRGGVDFGVRFAAGRFAGCFTADLSAGVRLAGGVTTPRSSRPRRSARR